MLWFRIASVTPSILTNTCRAFLNSRLLQINYLHTLSTNKSLKNNVTSSRKRNLHRNAVRINKSSRSQWPRGLRCRSTAARLLRLWVRIPPAAWMSVFCEYCVLSGRGLCEALITRPEESYRLWCVIVCDLETSRMWRLWPALGRSATGKK